MESSNLNATHVPSYLLGGMKANDTLNCLYGLKVGYLASKYLIESANKAGIVKVKFNDYSGII